MIADCAVEPSVMADWNHFQTLHNEFGIERGRLLSEFPGKWRKEVIECAQALSKEGAQGPIKSQTIVERLASEKFRRTLKRSGREFTGKGSWLEAAMSASPPLDLIVAGSAGELDNVVSADELLTSEEPFFRKTQAQIRRTAAELVGAGKLLFLESREFIIVDPFCRPDREGGLNKRFGETLVNLFKLLKRSDIATNRIEIHVRPDLGRDEKFAHFEPVRDKLAWERDLLSKLKGDIPFSVTYWNKLPEGGKLHARFILTDRGGIAYENGIDTGRGETLVTLLQDQMWEELYSDFDTQFSIAETKTLSFD